MAAVAMVTKVQNGSQIQKSSDLAEIWFPSRLWCCKLISIVGLLWWPFWIQDGYQNTKILLFWTKFGFQVDFDVGNWYPWLGSHIMIHFVGISTVVCCSFWRVEQIQNGGRCHGNQGIKWPPNTKILDLGEIWFPSRLWCCELIFIIDLLWWSELDETFQKFCLT